MEKTISLAILAGGILLVTFGVSASNSVSSDISRFLTDAPSDKAIWMLIVGAVVTVIGVMGLLRGSKG